MGYFRAVKLAPTKKHTEKAALHINHSSVKIWKDRAKAQATADKLQSHDEDGWSYRLTERDDGRYTVRIYDEEGEFVANVGPELATEQAAVKYDEAIAAREVYRILREFIASDGDKAAVRDCATRVGRALQLDSAGNNSALSRMAKSRVTGLMKIPGIAVLIKQADSKFGETTQGIWPT